MPTRERETNFRRFLAGAISGSIKMLSFDRFSNPISGTTSVFFTYPLEVIRVRMAFHTRNLDQTSSPSRPTFMHAARYIYREGTVYSDYSKPNIKNTLNQFPILKFYRGFTVTVIGMIPYAGVSFLSWGFLRSKFLHPSKLDHKEATPIADLIIGAVSGAIGQTASYPLEVVRRRFQVGGITSPDKWVRWGETVKTIWQTTGWRGFYIGLSIGYLKVVPMTAVSFAVWQGCKRLFNV